MATRSDIEGRVAEYTSRDDIDFSVVIPQALDALNRAVRINAQLEIIQYTAFADDAPDAAGRQFYALPDDYNDTAFIEYPGQSDPLDFLSPDQFFSPANPATVQQRAYTILGERLYLTTESGDDVQPATFNLGYYKALADLPNSGSTNVLTRKNSDILVYACCVEVYIIDEDEEREQKFKGRLDEKVALLNKTELRRRFNYANLRNTGNRRGIV